MTRLEALARDYETPGEDGLLVANDESDAELIARLFRVGAGAVGNYLDVQREFGWDDTH